MWAVAPTAAAAAAGAGAGAAEGIKSSLFQGISKPVLLLNFGDEK